ncbi:hypothetical protein [Terribacillus saccharophilus]|uniref:hypothetical protein n=1 Tax=Terribacillus saccharophilus TaxID=361277 RepID=UPI000BA72B8F|nr:hypothetical protein [Terribacillus saccharophilus]PAF16916.1 hypothetical protein CHH51_15030 [Terribacillus saccharophilus]
MITKSNMEFKPELIYVQFDKIKPIYSPVFTQTFMKRMRNTVKFHETFDLLLPVEKHPVKDEYILVGRYDVYSFIKDDGLLKEVPVVIEEYTEETLQFLKILRRLHNKGDASKSNKQSILNMLQLKKIPLSLILKKTGFTKQDFSNYNYNEDILSKYINTYTTEQTLNWIYKLKLEEDVKDFLYNRAGLPQGNAMRLTDEKRKFLQLFFIKADRFLELLPSQQIEVLANALNYKEIAMSFLQKQIDNFLD